MVNKAIICASLLVMIVMTNCSSKKKEQDEEMKFSVTSPLKKDTSTIKDYVCQIHAIQHIEVRALESGYLESIHVDEGKLVKKGQLMFQILPLIYKAELQKAEAEVEFANIEYKNAKRLADSNVVSVNEAALAKAKLEKASAQMSMAKVHLGFTQIKAPFDGIMDRFYVRLGSLINESDLLTTLSDNSKMWVYFNVPEAEYLDYKTHAKKDSLMRVSLLMANNQHFPYLGIVQTIEADFNNETGNIAFRATFSNPKGLLRHGETGNIEMTVPLDHALLIPQMATFEVLEKKYVFVVGKDNKVEQREITIAAEIPDLYAIKNGLSENDKIIFSGIRKVSNGDKIEYEYHDPKKVLSELKVYVE